MKRLDIKIENLVRLIENDDSVCFVEESPMKQVISYFARKEKSSDCFTFKNGLVNGINAFLRKAHKIGEGQYGVCYERFGLVFKISKDFLNDLKKPGDFSLPLDSSYSINATQERNQRNFNRENLRPSYIDQEAMSKIFEKKQKYPFIYNSLPIKYINFYNCRIGVIYKYHKDYKNINNLINEDWQTFLNVLVNIGNCQRELIEAKIYYMDYKSENILYKGTDVKIIDLDIPNPNIYGYNNFDELISFERNARTPEGIRIIKERNERLPMESYGKLRIIIYPIIMNKLMHEHNYIPENDEKINNIVDQIYNQTIINCNCNGLLEIINKYIELNQTKSRTK